MPTISASGRLRFERVDWRHVGNYTCWAENEAGRAHFSYRLDVMSAPGRIGVVAVDGQPDGHRGWAGQANVADEQEDELTELTVAAGESVFAVECVVVANPVPKVRSNCWLIDSFTCHCRGSRQMPSEEEGDGRMV